MFIRYIVSKKKKKEKKETIFHLGNWVLQQNIFWYKKKQPNQPDLIIAWVELLKSDVELLGGAK